MELGRSRCGRCGAVAVGGIRAVSPRAGRVVGGDDRHRGRPVAEPAHLWDQADRRHRPEPGVAEPAGVAFYRLVAPGGAGLCHGDDSVCGILRFNQLICPQAR
ncbi:hypothetical protein D3C78_727370 [compost metagenome]